MTSLELRKQLLVAESELNRAQLSRDVAKIALGVHTLAERARSFASIASAGAVLLTGMAAYQRERRSRTGAMPSTLKRVLEGAGLVSALWLAYRAQRTPRRDERQDEGD